MNDKVQLVDVEAEITLTYTVDDTPVTNASGDTILVDRVKVRYFYPEEDDTSRFSIEVEGWRTTASGARDKRKKERVRVLLGWRWAENFIKNELGINYEEDFEIQWNVRS
jgi:hypothetical protein